MADANLKIIVTELYDKGLSLNEILDVLVSEKEMNVTFMDVRLIVSEIEDERDMYEEEEVEEEEVIDEEGPVEDCAIEMSSILQPGAAPQGSAKFKSGTEIKFMLDRQGRIGIEPVTENQPTEEELTLFQQELVKKLQSRPF
ncbi:MAG: hypothetical protein COA79_16895 [Planctomycetota bacterium]|nr:MAG: hypothetical protein COA79_16895 [Planctomycetota bacterium]